MDKKKSGRPSVITYMAIVESEYGTARVNNAATFGIK